MWGSNDSTVRNDVCGLHAARTDVCALRAYARVFDARVGGHVATPTRMSVRIRTRLYAALVKAKSHRTFACPR